MESEEDWIGLGIRSNTKTWFKLKDEPEQKKARLKYGPLELHILLSPDKHIYKRQIYSGIDWMGDVGGVFSALNIVGLVIVHIFTFLFG